MQVIKIIELLPSRGTAYRAEINGIAGKDARKLCQLGLFVVVKQYRKYVHTKQFSYKVY